MTLQRQGWLYSPVVDTCFILAPPFVATFAAITLTAFGMGTDVSLWWWVVLVIGVDVAHVYATLFRTYFHRAEIARRPVLYTLVPICAWAGGSVLYGIDPLLFWRVLAYLAVFHFIRQQYGFVMIYARTEKRSTLARRIDALTIYMAAVYPLVYWHSHLPRAFQWFVEGDFVALPAIAEPLMRSLYIVTLIAYIAKEAARARTHGVNVPKNMIVAGTAISWFTGIVLLNGDLAFTLTNVLAHGVPYLALIWLHGHRALAHEPEVPKVLFARLFGALRWSVGFCALLVLFAYVEEGLWDGLIWREHLSVFPFFRGLPPVHDSMWLAVIIPLLTVPQVSHYVLDGFIWRVRDPRVGWLRTMAPRSSELTPPASLRRSSPAPG